LTEAALDVLNSLPYRRWRDANPEDTLRFLALRLHEVDLTKSPPQKLVSGATDWRFLNALRERAKSVATAGVQAYCAL
jgi:NitT/TauT family transport system substrate-binding protein